MTEVKKKKKKEGLVLNQKVFPLWPFWLTKKEKKKKKAKQTHEVSFWVKCKHFV